MASERLEIIAKVIKSAKSVLIFTHMRPDGDAFGSALALSHALNGLGIRNAVLDESDVPPVLDFLDGVDTICKNPPFDAELYVAVDCADVFRLGELADVFLKAKGKKTTVNIDHHISNTRYAKYDYVRECSANCMNIFALVQAMGAPIDKKTANCLMAGLLTDSGNFSHDDVTEETFLTAAKLMTYGADIKLLSEKLFKRQSKERAGLYADAMSRVRYALDGRFAAICMTLDDFAKFNAKQNETEGFVDFPLSIEGVEVAAALMEIKKGQFKVSLRSKVYADVNKIAGVYGGGGHVRAAGCMLFGEKEEVLDKLTYTVSQYLE
ncbi:MAG: bifunctional oligoribonuclease/PAP phosphatase NrnA [Clostridia bacterium]|nr:bifunctional oligoribonuclease/PAP phosphatase NrnA [Clostridia bacterium]